MSVAGRGVITIRVVLVQAKPFVITLVCHTCHPLSLGYYLGDGLTIVLWFVATGAITVFTMGSL